MAIEIYDFSSYSGFTETGGGGYFHNVNPLHWDADFGGTCQLIYRSPSVIVTDGNPFQLFARFKSGGSGVGALEASMGLFVYDDTNYVMCGQYQDTTHSPTSGSFYNVKTDYADVWATPQGEIAAANEYRFYQTTWTWICIEFDGDETWNVYYLNNNESVRPEIGDMYLRNTFTQALGSMTSFGIFNKIDTHFAPEFYADDLTLISSPGQPIQNSIINGTTVKAAAIYARNTIGKVGASARIVYHDPRNEKVASIESSMQTALTVMDTKFYTRFFQGEISQYDLLLKEVIAQGLQTQLKSTVANHDPVVTSGSVEHINGNTLYKKQYGNDVGPTFSTLGVSADDLIVFVKKNLQTYTSHPQSASLYDSGETPLTPDDESGSIDNLFHEIKDTFADSQRGYNVQDSDPFFIEIPFTALVKDGSTINKAQIEIKVRPRPRGTTHIGNQYQLPDDNYEYIQIWDDDASQWVYLDGGTSNPSRLANQASKSTKLNDFGTPKGLLKTITIDFGAIGTLTDYYSISSANSYDWKTVTFKLRLYSGGNTVSLPTMTVEYAALTLDLDIDQEQEVAVAKIQTVNDHNLVLYGSGSISWLDEDARDDGISTGDEYFITNSISTIAADMWTNSGIENYLNLNFDVSNEIPDIEDIRWTSILQVLQKWTELLGAVFYIDYTGDPENDLPTLNFVDSFDDSGLTLTDADFIDSLRQVAYKVDSSEELSNLKLQGGSGIAADIDITTEHTPALGLKTRVINRPDIHTTRQAAQWLSKKSLLFKNSKRFVTGRINFDRANQDYTALKMGRLVNVNIPSDASIVDLDSGGDGQVLIYQMELNRNWQGGYQNYVTVMLQLRVLS